MDVMSMGRIDVMSMGRIYGVVRGDCDPRFAGDSVTVVSHRHPFGRSTSQSPIIIVENRHPEVGVFVCVVSDVVVASP